jgi:hypothetical protein
MIAFATHIPFTLAEGLSTAFTFLLAIALCYTIVLGTDRRPR